MAETPRDLDSRDLPEVYHESHFSAYLSKQTTKDTKLGRFLQKINLYFKNEAISPTDIHLAGRIRELDKNLDGVLAELNQVKEELEKEVDPDLFNLVNAVVDPLVKECNRLKNTNAAKVDGDFQKYAQWIEKAKMWVELCSKRNEKEAIIEAVIDYNSEEFKGFIDRDLKLIQDYLNHFLDTIPDDKELGHTIRLHIEDKVVPHLIALQELKEKNYIGDFSHLSKWRATVHHLREQHFSDALHAIDLLAQTLSPVTEEEIEHPDHDEVEIFHRIEKLEQKVAKLADQIPSLESADIDRKKYCETQFSLLENEAHQLNSDLRLSQPQIEHLQALMNRLATIRNKINQ